MLFNQLDEMSEAASKTIYVAMLAAGMSAALEFIYFVSDLGLLSWSRIVFACGFLAVQWFFHLVRNGFFP